MLFYFKSSDLKCQSMQTYIDSVKQYQSYVDSLIKSYYSNPATSLLHGIIHYNCLNENGVDKGYGSGGSADIYQDPKTKKVFQLTYIKECDTITTERTLYFIDNRIVLAIISDKGKNTPIYYRQDKFLNVGNLDVVTEKFSDKALQEGYEVLKDFN